jgi:hypothetical protein
MSAVDSICFVEAPRNGDSSVGIVTGYRLDGRCSIHGRCKEFLSSPQRPNRFWNPPSLIYNADHSHSSTAEVKNDEACFSTPLCIFMA